MGRGLCGQQWNGTNTILNEILIGETMIGAEVPEAAIVCCLLVAAEVMMILVVVW